MGEGIDDLFGHAVAEVLLFLIRTQIGEGKHRDGGPRPRPVPLAHGKTWVADRVLQLPA